MLKLRVPATTANLGPGFDCLGLALSIHHIISMKLLPAGDYRITIEGPPGSEFLPKDENNLLVRAARKIFALAGKPEPGLQVHMELHAPLARGLGSSASAIVAGMMGANELLGRPIHNEALLLEMVTMEGHPDNVAPCFHGGLTASVHVENGVHVERTMPAESLSFVLFVPDYPLETRRAREVMPKNVPIRDAVFNISRVIPVFRALEKGDMESLSFIMEDCLHQPYRIPLIKGYSELAFAVREAGAAAVCISGAGPSVLAVVSEEQADEVREAGLATLADLGVDAMGLIAEADAEGCIVIPGAA